LVRFLCHGLYIAFIIPINSGIIRHRSNVRVVNSTKIISRT
jgi:hypothetical protein